MISIWQFGLLVGALITIFISFKNMRGITWVLIAALNFILCTAFQRAGLPYHPGFVLFLDLSTCIVIDIYRKYQWELQIYNLFRISVIVSICRIFELPLTETFYTPLLEFINWLVLIIVFNQSLISTNIVGHYVKDYITVGLSFFGCSSRETAKTPAWYKRWR